MAVHRVSSSVEAYHPTVPIIRVRVPGRTPFSARHSACDRNCKFPQTRIQNSPFVFHCNTRLMRAKIAVCTFYNFEGRSCESHTERVVSICAVQRKEVVRHQANTAFTSACRQTKFERTCSATVCCQHAANGLFFIRKDASTCKYTNCEDFISTPSIKQTPHKHAHTEW